MCVYLSVCACICVSGVCVCVWIQPADSTLKEDQNQHLSSESGAFSVELQRREGRKGVVIHEQRSEEVI